MVDPELVRTLNSARCEGKYQEFEEHLELMSSSNQREIVGILNFAAELAPLGCRGVTLQGQLHLRVFPVHQDLNVVEQDLLDFPGAARVL